MAQVFGLRKGSWPQSILAMLIMSQQMEDLTVLKNFRAKYLIHYIDIKLKLYSGRKYKCSWR